MRELLWTMAIAVLIIGLSPIAKAESKTRRSSATSTSRPNVSTPADTSKTPAPLPVAATGKKSETAIFAGGCFWCMEFAFEQLAGVVDVQSGYCGGTRATANYDLVHLGTTGHAEAIRVTYDPDKVTYNDLLGVFFDSHDPTQLNRQGEDDIGRQYRSAIFFANEEQQKQAKAKIADLDSKRVHKRKIVTKLEPLKEFYPAEDYHQDFARRNPLVPYVQFHAVPKALNVRTKHPELIRDQE